MSRATSDPIHLLYFLTPALGLIQAIGRNAVNVWDQKSELVSGDSEAIRKFSDKYIVPEKLVAEYVEHLAQIKMRKEKKKEETERE